MATSDLHGHVLPFDYAKQKPRAHGSLAQLATVISNTRRSSKNTLLFDNGDVLQGTALAVTSALPRQNPVISAMNAIGYDAGNTGNHDLDYGLDWLLAAFAQAKHPCISSNLHLGAQSGPSHPLLPYVVIDRKFVDQTGKPHALKIGVFGVMPMQTLAWNHQRLHGKADISDMVTAAQIAIAALNDAHSDIIVALAHTGIGRATPTQGMENAALLLADLSDIDAMVLGHTHQRFPGPDHPNRKGLNSETGHINEIPAVMPGFRGSDLGMIDLTLEKTTAGWQRIASNTSLVSCCDLAVSDQVLEAVAPAHAKALTRLEEKIGERSAPLHSYFSHLGKDPAAQFVAEALHFHVARELGAHAGADVPIVCAVPPYKCGGRGGPDNYVDIPSGPLRMRHIDDLCPYPNMLSVLRLSFEQVVAWLEATASVFNQVTEGETGQHLVDDQVPSYVFDVLYGLSYQIDVTQPALFDRNGVKQGSGTGRISDIRHQGKPLHPNQTIIVVTNSHRLGRELVTENKRFEVLAIDPKPIPLILEEFARSQSPSALELNAPWKFKPLPDTPLLFRTGPGAINHLASLDDLKVESFEKLPSGFLNIVLHL